MGVTAMKFSKWMTTILGACAFLVACDGKKDGTGKSLTVGVSADYAPFEYFKDGEIIGFDIDLMKEVAKRLNKEVKFKDMSFDAILGSLTTSRLDAAISSITPTNERRKSIDFSQEYIKSNRVLLCKGTSSVESASDLAGDTIGVQSGSTHEAYAKESLSKDVNLTVKSLTKVPDLLQDMEIGNSSCLVLGIQEAEAIKSSKPSIKLLTLPGEVSGAAIAFPKGSPLTPQVDKILDDMEADGTMEKLKAQWLINQTTPPKSDSTVGTDTPILAPESTPPVTTPESTAEVTPSADATTSDATPTASTPEGTPDTTTPADTTQSEATPTATSPEATADTTPPADTTPSEATPTATTPEGTPDTDATAVETSPDTKSESATETQPAISPDKTSPTTSGEGTSSTS